MANENRQEQTEENPDLTQALKPSGNSESEGTSLDGMRGVSPGFHAADALNAVEEPSAPDAPDALKQMLEGDTPAEEDGSEEASPTDGDGQQQAQLSESEVDDDVAALQERLLVSDKDRTRRAQESAFLKGKLGELDPYIQLGIAVKENPQLSAYVDQVLKGEPVTQAQQKAGDQASKSMGMTPEVFLDTVVKQVSQKVTKDVQQTMDANTTAARQWDKIDTRARKELKHYDQLQQHPAYLGWVSAMNQAIDNGTLLVPDGENPNYHAIAKAHDVMIATNPEYITAVHDAGVTKGKKSNAKKMAGAGPTGSSRGSTHAWMQTPLLQKQKNPVVCPPISD